MKKLLALLLSCVMLLSLTACGGMDTTVDDKSDHTTATTTTTTTITTTTTRTTTTTKAPDTSVWETRYYVDDFDQPTDEWYVTNKSYFVGKFSNSATTNSTLYVRVLVDADSFAFMLYEYGRNQVKNSYSRSESYIIKMKDTSGKQYDLSGHINSNGDRLFVDSSDEQTVINALKKSGEVHFVIYESDRTVTQYKFSVKTSNFSKLIK